MIWIIGAGDIASEYAMVLKSLGEEFIVIGRGRESAVAFFNKTGIKVEEGGLDDFLNKKPMVASRAIVAVDIIYLDAVTQQLTLYGVKNILIEKPGALSIEAIQSLNNQAKLNNINIYIAYNRRFFSSVIEAKKIIAEDGGVKSFNFEFTEWGHIIETLDFPDEVMRKWFLANSSHVVDLAFFLGGRPKEISCYNVGSNLLSWYGSPSVFAGSGISEWGAIFSYQANWSAPGRWGVEILTSNRRLILRPMESLKVQQIGSIDVDVIELDDKVDLQFKPGFYKQVKSFLCDCKSLKTIAEQVDDFNLYYKMASYND